MANIVGNNNNVKALPGIRLQKTVPHKDNVEHGGHDIVLDISGHYNTNQEIQNSISGPITRRYKLG